MKRAALEGVSKLAIGVRRWLRRVAPGLHYPVIAVQRLHDLLEAGHSVL
jgi:hypothetical protein